MATARDESDQWESATPHQWKEESDEEDDGHQFYDATDEHPSTTEANLLHNRLNEQLNIPKTTIEDPYFIDEDVLKERDALLNDDDREKRHIESQKMKDEGNELFHRGEYDQALAKYSEALSFCPLKHSRDRAIIYANRAACLTKMEKFESAIQSCTKSIEFDGTYLKPYLRRAEAYKRIDKLDEALTDYQKILELDPNNAQARQEVHILPEQIKERNEKLKAEMLDKLKDLGNMILKPFGLSTNNFKLQQDPNTGSYSVNFQK